ncbi:MAG: dienelactone hydrolase family protein [Pseudomonadota bacterium]
MSDETKAAASPAPLTGPRRGAPGDGADRLVILLHGYGADGEDLIGIGDALAGHLPNTRFLAPNAPQRCTNNPAGYQWFPIPWMDGSSEADMRAGFSAAAQAIDGFLDHAAEAEGIGPDRTALIGFSQGTMMSLHVGLRRSESLAGIVGFSGRLIAPERLEAEIASRPPVLLAHGRDDQVVPFTDMAAAEAGLRAAGVEVSTHASPGTGHGIAPDGLGAALGFLTRVLG